MTGKCKKAQGVEALEAVWAESTDEAVRELDPSF